jgi:sugar phosphate isomerase/epimerase
MYNRLRTATLAQFGLCYPDVAEHRFPGPGQVNWPEIVRELIQAGYDSDLKIEGWHGTVFHNHVGRAQLEDTGLLMSKRTLKPLVAGME